MAILQMYLTAGLAWACALAVGRVLYFQARENKNPLEWSKVDRCLLILSILFFLVGMTNFLIGLGQQLYVKGVPWIDWEYMNTFLNAQLILGGSAILFMFIGLWLRRKYPDSSLFAHLFIQSTAVSVAYFCHVFGPATHPGPVLFAMALGITYLLLFEPSLALPWIATFTVLLIGSMVAVSLGYLTYAPGLISSPFSAGRIEGVYLAGTISFVLLVFILMLALIGYVFTRWRDREVKLADMTVLLKKIFGRYLSTEVMNTIIDNPLALELGGERRWVTIMVTDLRGFTSLSERVEPERVVQMLNNYFEVMVDVVLSFNGTINEIIGDSLLVVFGAPQAMPDRATQAVACALVMQNAMAEVNQANRGHGLPELEMGIGLNEAGVIVGNIGSSKRSQYTVVGSGVNMASRIESYTVGGQILVSESVYKQAGDILRIDGRQEVWPKGAESPITIYEVGGIAGEFNVSLDKEDDPPVTLNIDVGLTYMVLEGKHVEGRIPRGRLVGLSRRSAEVILSEPAPPLTNLKMNLEVVDEELAIRDFYGKVVEGPTQDRGAHLIRFTALPPEVAAYFQAHRQYSQKS